MKVSFFSFFTALLFFTWSTDAQAESQVVSCGAPVEMYVNTEVNYKICNIYDRQLAYYATDKTFMDKLKQRQVNFHAPNSALRQEYQDKLNAHHDSIGSSTE